jgi:hypothetical protein
VKALELLVMKWWIVLEVVELVWGVKGEAFSQMERQLGLWKSLRGLRLICDIVPAAI